MFAKHQSEHHTPRIMRSADGHFNLLKVFVVQEDAFGGIGVLHVKYLRLEEQVSETMESRIWWCFEWADHFVSLQVKRSINSYRISLCPIPNQFRSWHYSFWVSPLIPYTALGRWLPRNSSTRNKNLNHNISLYATHKSVVTAHPNTVLCVPMATRSLYKIMWTLGGEDTEKKRLYIFGPLHLC